MKLSRFNIYTTVLSILVAFSGFFAVWFLLTNHLWVTRITMVVLWGVLTFNLIRYVQLMTRKLDTFLSSLRYLDNIRQEKHLGRSFDDLNLTFNEIIDIVGQARKDMEAQGHYFRSIVEQADTGLMTFDDKGRIRIINRSALDLLDLPALHHIHDLKALREDLPEKLKDLKSGENQLFTLVRSGRIRRLNFRVSKMIVQNDPVTIVSFQDIHNQLELEELEAWKKLIAVLRHEIMNSAAPLRSLSFSLRRLTRKITGKENDKVLKDLNEGLDVITNRSESLLNFVDAYRALTKMPSARFQTIRLRELLEEVRTLFKAEIQQRRIKLVILTGTDEPELEADYNLLSQALINLVRNALNAVQDEEGIITLSATRQVNGPINISVSDNGSGISEEEQKNIFIPFYTTREGGSGIGLSLVRQILREHNAIIDVISTKGSGSIFTMRF